MKKKSITFPRLFFGSKNSGDYRRIGRHLVTSVIAVLFSVNAFSQNPKLSTTINGVTVNSDNDGTDDEASFSVCNTSGNIVFGPFYDQNGNTGSTVKAYQILEFTNASSTMCSPCSAPLSVFNGGAHTVSLIDPNMSGTMVMKYREWIDTDNDGVIDGDESVALDQVIYTVTINSTLYYVDSDGDGYGDANDNTGTPFCTAPETGWSSNNKDCDDEDPGINPGATEVCNDKDDDCDGDTDEGVQSTFYRDVDGDTYGDLNSPTQACSAPEGYVEDNTDCNDDNASVNPGATEICNTIDDDCDGETDEGVKSTFYRDADSDNYGNPDITTEACSAPEGYVSDNTDCNDGNAAVNPGATEICNKTDDDCDGQTDEGLTQYTYYQDSDGDSYGNPNNTTMTCSPVPPPGYVSNNYDCDDSPKKPDKDPKVMMCHKGKGHCVKEKDVQKNLDKKGDKWALGPCALGKWDLNSDNYVTVYPNPATDQITVSVNTTEEQTLTVKIISITGEILFTTEEPNLNGYTDISLDLSNYAAGMYFIHVSYGDKFERFKVQKVN